MKTEDFDDAIRKKVNSIYHTYKEDDIEKIHNYVSLKRNAATRLRYAKVAAFSTVAVLVAALLTWNFVQFRERKEMAAKLDSLQDKLAQMQSPIVKTDTVYLKEYITKDGTAAEQLASGNLNPDKNFQNGQNETENQDVKDKGFADNQLNTSTKNINNTSKKNRNNTNNNTSKHFSGNSYLETEKNPLAKNENKRNSDNKKIAVNDKNSAEENVIPIEKYPPTKTIDLYEIIDKPGDSTYIASEKNALDTAENTVMEKNPVVTNEIIEVPKLHQETIKTGKNKSFSLSNFHYNIGLGLETANHQRGIGIASQVFFTDRIGLNVGLKALGFENDRFRDTREFGAREGRDFKEVCGPKLQDTADIQNIDRQTMLVQIPVSITYVLPVKNGFGISFAAGTDIDLVAKQRIGFDRHRINEPQTGQNLTLNVPVSTFNNATISIGAQKLWGHFMLQASPFLSPQLKKVEYKKEPVYAGLNIKALYSF